MKRKCFIIICISIVLFITQSHLFSDETIFYENFTNNDNEWPVEDNEYARTTITNDTYVFEYKIDDGGYHIYYPVYIDADRNFEIKATFYQISGHDDRGYGLIWDMIDDSNYYEFNITDNGYYRITKTVDGEWCDVIEWTESEYINTYGGKNILTIAKLADFYTFFINNNYVNLAEVQPLGGDYVGFDIWLKQKIVIESLEVSYIEDMDIILDEDFSDNDLAWFEGNNSEMYTEVKNGYYYFQHKEQDGSYFIWNYVDIIPENDFEISTTLTHTSGVSDYGYGLLWGMSDLDNLFCFNISDNGYYRYGKYVNDEWEIMIGWTESEFIKTYNGTNTLTVERTSDLYNFYINDGWVDSYEYEPLFGDAIGYVIFKDQTLKIDNLIVKQALEGSGTIFEQAAVLLEDISVEYPVYNELYRTLADAYWEEAESAVDMEDKYEHAMIYLKSAKAEILSDDPGLNELADALSNAGYLLNAAVGTEEERKENYKDAYSYYEIVIQVDEDFGNESHLVNDYVNIGVSANNLGYYDDAISFYTKALNCKIFTRCLHF